MILKLIRGFTLAEVLITLGVIGVVSAVTLPTLIKNYQKHETVNRLKQTYSILYQAVRMSETENGLLETWEIPDIAWNSEEQYSKGKIFAEKYLLPYLKTAVSDCGIDASKCIPDKIYNMDKSENDMGTYSKYRFVLVNGVVVQMVSENNGTVVSFIVDLNGKSNPNTIGKDIFMIYAAKNGTSGSWYGKVNKSGLYFAGQGFSRNELSGLSGTYVARGCKPTGKGQFCGALIMLDGWKIAPDYPW